MPTIEALTGYTAFYNNAYAGNSLTGYTYFFEYLEPLIKQGFAGYTYFYGDFFPPEGVSASYSYVKVPTFDTTIVNFGSRVEQATDNDTNVRYSYKLNFKTLTKFEADLIKDFFVAHLGRTRRFYLKDPITQLTVSPVRFDIDLAEIELFYYQLYNYNEITLIELGG